MACNLDSRLEQLEEQGKTMADATRRLLETVNAVKDTGELLLQMIENHQKMLEMSRRVETLINDVKTEVKVETISDEEEDWGDNSPPTPHVSEDWDAEADDMPFYIPVRRTITVEQWGVRCPACGGRPSRFGWLVGFVALRPKSTAMVIAGRSVHLTTLFPGQA